MLVSIAYFLPCLVSLLWLSIFLLKVKNMRQKIFTCINALNVVYYAAYAFYIMPDITDYYSMVVIDSISVPSVLFSLVFIVSYMYIINCRKKPSNKMNLLLVPAIVMGTNIDLLYYIIGYDKAAAMARMYDQNIPYPDEFRTEVFQVYGFMVDKVVGAVALGYMIIITWFATKILRKEGFRFGDTYRFFFKGKKSSTSRVIAFLIICLVVFMLPLSLLGRKHMMMNPTVGLSLTIAVAIVLFLTNYVEYFCDSNQSFTLSELYHIHSNSYDDFNNDDGSAMAHRMEEEQHQTSKMEMKHNMQAEQLRRLFEVEHIYKDDELTIASLADKMGIGRTTLSALVKAMHDMPFRDMLNNYRIEAVKQFMLSNPTATQEVIAQECGFKSSSYMNTKFKDITGETPSMWLAKQSHRIKVD